GALPAGPHLLRVAEAAPNRSRGPVECRNASRLSVSRGGPPGPARRIVGTFPDSGTLVPVVLRLVRPRLRHADVLRLLVAQLGERGVERRELEPGDLFFEQLGQDVHPARAALR